MPAARSVRAYAPGFVTGMTRRILAGTWRALASMGPLLVGVAGITFALHHLTIVLGSRVAIANGPAGLGLLALAITIRLAAVAVMVLIAARALDIDLNVIARALGMPAAAEESTDRPLSNTLDTVVAALGPMVLLYAGWQLVNADLHQFLVGKFAASSDSNFVDNSNIGFSGGGWQTYIGWAVGIWVAKVALQRLGRVILHRSLSVVVMFLETSWIVLAWLVVTSVVARIDTWARSRQLATWWRDLVGLIGDALAPLAIELPAVLSAAGRLLAELVQILLFALAQPLVWVAVVGLVLGWGASEASLLSADHRRRAVERWAPRSGHGRRAVAMLTSGWRDKWVPVLAALRLLWRSGPLPLLTIAALYAVGTFLGSWAEHLVTSVVDSDGLLFTESREMVGRLTAFVLEPVRVCFLVAAFAEILRLRARHAVRNAQRSKVTA